MMLGDAKKSKSEKNGILKEQLQTTFVIIAIVSFSLTIIVNFYTLRRLQAGK